MPTTPRRLFRQVRARPGQHHRPPADRRRRARSRHEPAQGRAARHQRHARPGRDQLELVDPSRRAAAARGGGRGAAGAAAARVACGLACRSGSLTVSKGVVSVDGEAGGRSVKYGDLLGDKPFNVKFTGTAPQKPVNRYKLVGTRVPRVDIPDKVARQIRRTCSTCACPTCCTAASCCRADSAPSAPAPSRSSVDESSIKDIPSARVVRKGDFIGVVAEHEWDAVKAARELKVTWQEPPALPGNADLFEQDARREDDRHGDRRLGRCREGLRAGRACARRRPIAVPTRAICRSRRTARSPMSRPDGALVHVLDAGRLQRAQHARDRARACRPRRSACSTTKAPAPSAAAATRMPRRPPRSCRRRSGRPVRVQFMRWDEHGWDNYGPAHLAEVRAGIDANGKLVAYEYHGWQHGWTVTSTVHDIALQKPGVERAAARPRSPSTR